MAPSAASDATVPPGIDQQFGGARRVVVSSTCSAVTLSVASEMATRHGVPVTTAMTMGSAVVDAPATGDLFVHGLPDTFGRLMSPPSDREWAVVVDRATGDLVRCESPVIEVGTARDGRLIAGGLHLVFKRLCQQRRVRPLFSAPPPLGLPFIAPDGIAVDEPFVHAERVSIPGLPDLVVVRPTGFPSPKGHRLQDPAIVIP